MSGNSGRRKRFEMSAKTTPIRIYLQWNGDSEPEDNEPCLEEVTWSQEQIFKHDVEYIRADSVKALLHTGKLNNRNK